MMLVRRVQVLSKPFATSGTGPGARRPDARGRRVERHRPNAQIKGVLKGKNSQGRI